MTLWEQEWERYTAWAKRQSSSWLQSEISYLQSLCSDIARRKTEICSETLKSRVEVPSVAAEMLQHLKEARELLESNSFTREEADEIQAELTAIYFGDWVIKK